MNKSLMLGFTALCAVLSIAGIAHAAEPVPTLNPSGGVIPEGIWVLNQERSQKLKPGRQTVFIIRDDGKQQIWTAIQTSPQGEVKINSFSGAYAGPLSPVVGTDMTTQIWSPGPGKFQNRGEIKGVGTYSEDCDILVAQKRFVCRGEVTTPKGVQKWIDDFDWVGPIPH